MNIGILFEVYFLFLILLIYGSALLLKAIFSKGYMKKDYSLTPSVSVIFSAFNEGKGVLNTIDSIFQSEYKGKLDVLVADDRSTDDTWEWIKKAKDKYPQLTIFINDKNQGKAKTLLFLLDNVKSEFTVITDSDTTVDKHTIAELMATYTDDSIGAVGGMARVANGDKNFLTGLQRLQYNRVFQLARFSEAFLGNVRCISGALLSVRTALYRKVAPRIKHRTWGGLPVMDSEDSFMTHLITLEGYKTLYNNKAPFHTHVPETFRTYFSQQVRWRRASIRMFLWSLSPSVFGRLFVTRSPVSFFRIFLIQLFIVSFPVFVLWSVITTGIPNLTILNFQLFLLFISIGIISLIIAWLNNEEARVPISSLFILPMWMGVNLFFLTIYAAFTLAASSWQTRS